MKLSCRRIAMSEVTTKIGQQIKQFRKTKRLTQEQLARAIHKSKPTIAKYESGMISVDIETLYKIADALNVHVEELLIPNRQPVISVNQSLPRTFFQNTDRLYTYVYDGRNNQLLKSVLMISTVEETKKYRTAFYMNVPDFDRYFEAENSYWGYTEHHDSLTSIYLEHQSTGLEKVTINIMSTFLETDQKWGMMSGVSFRPFMPVAWKMLFSKQPLKEDDILIQRLKINKEDIRLMKMFNLFNVM
jgi:transcriptional regulator with XRE-family HTH domain